MKESMYEPSDLCFEDHLMCLQDVKGFPGRRMTAERMIKLEIQMERLRGAVVNEAEVKISMTCSRDNQC